MSKIKVLTYNKAGYDKAVKHATRLGAISRDGNTAFNADKTALVIDGKYMQSSRAGYTPKKNPYDIIISIDQFRAMTSLTLSKTTGSVATAPSGVSKQQSDAAVKTAKAVGYSVGFADGEAVGYAVGHTDGEAHAAPQKTLKCTKAKVIVQNPIVWATMGIPFFKANGLDIVESDGKMYTLDIVTNSSKEFTAQSVAEQAEKDLLAGDATIYTSFVKNFDLADELVYTKVLVDEDKEA